MSRKIFIDIKPPVSIINWTGNHSRFKREIKRGRIKKKARVVIAVLAGTAFILGALLIFEAYHFQNRAEQSIPGIYGYFKEFSDNLLALRLEEARKSLKSAEKEINFLASSPMIKLLGKEVVFDELTRLVQLFNGINENLEYFREKAFSDVVGKSGDELTGKLLRLARNLGEVRGVVENLNNYSIRLGYSFDRELLADKMAEISKVQQFLYALIDWFNQARPQNVLVLFQNSSEIRPTGGFIGSYAEIVLAKANLSSLKVNDIYEPDGQLGLKVIPPKPLQLITTSWGARDANWFFDFPISAEKVLKFLEASGIYQERAITFSTAIALNVNVIKDILEFIGPIKLPEYDLVIDGSNFLAEVQREVEAGQDKKAGEPKKILKVLVPKFLEKLTAVSDTAKKKALLERLKGHLTAKDVMFYFRDPTLQKYVESFGFAGEVFNLPAGFRGDYLAVVNSNIGGGKSDAFVKQTIKLESKIDLNGVAQNNLTIERAHSGADQKDWWYRAANKNYIQVLAPKNAALTSASGNVDQNARAPISYKAKGYQPDPDVNAIELSANLLSQFGVVELREFGKKAFAAWLTVPAGTKKTLEMKYQIPNAIAVENGARYQFIFDKQSGVNGRLAFSIEAPPGYKWAQNNKAVFTYFSDNVPGRLIVDLSLLTTKR